MPKFFSEKGRADRLHTLLNATDEIILLLDLSGSVVEGNEAAARVIRDSAGGSLPESPSTT